MNEVSTKVFGFFMGPLEKKGVALETMVEGTGVRLAQLRDKKERVDWSKFLAIMANLRRHFTDDEYIELGRSYFRSAGLRFAFVIARVLLTPMGFYRWLNKPREGAGNQMFTCIVPTHREISENECEVDLIVADGFEVCWDFYVISIGNFEEMPKLLGYPAAKVTLERLPRGGRFHITIPTRMRLLTRIRRAITWPFTVRAAAKELKAAHETLVERFEQIEAARVMLDGQATQLRTAHAVNDLIHGDLDLERTLGAVTKALVAEAGFASAEITLGGGGVAKFGEPTAELPLVRVLAARGGEALGELRVVPRRAADRDERDQLLAFIVPTVVMALQNALSYRELEGYRANLEKLVEERTAELRQARDQLSGTVEQLREAQGARERFFGNISHEIRTPLSLILLAVADVEARAGKLLDERSRGGLNSVSDAARKLVRLVDELLLLAAGQEDKLRLHPEPTDLALLLGNLAAAWRPAAEAAGLTLEIRVPAHLLANVDPVAIERVASNLMSNAVKYTPRGGQLAIELADEDAGLRLSVLDSGPGIDPELAGRLFGRFERAIGEDRRKVGTGIGLALVKQLVVGHGGTVAALPRTQGTEMRVVLPSQIVIREVVSLAPGAATRLRLVEDSTPNLTGITSGTKYTPPGVSKGTIVIAEDNAQLAEMTARLLSDDYTVIVGLDGLAALELVKRHQPQLLITDVDMPGMNGIELSRQFRELTGDSLAPIIILSAVIDLGTRVAGLEAGAVDYVTKPFDAAELVARVKAQFRMRDLAIRLHRAEQLAALGILTSGLAHELRNPANGIVNAIGPLTDLLPKELTGPETGVGQLLDAMGGCATQIAFLTRQLLGFRRGGDLELRPAQIPTLVHRATTLAKSALVDIEIRTDVVFDREVMCAPPLLIQVLTNLIENAGHAAGVGGWVEIRGRSANGRSVIEVADSGPGVPLELRERVFEPFFTTKPQGKGTGLGLAVARTIVDRHHGLLEIRERDSRSIFVIDLPDDSSISARANAV